MESSMAVEVANDETFVFSPPGLRSWRSQASKHEQTQSHRKNKTITMEQNQVRPKVHNQGTVDTTSMFCYLLDNCLSNCWWLNRQPRDACLYPTDKALWCCKVESCASFCNSVGNGPWPTRVVYAYAKHDSRL